MPSHSRRVCLAPFKHARCRAAGIPFQEVSPDCSISSVCLRAAMSSPAQLPSPVCFTYHWRRLAGLLTRGQRRVLPAVCVQVTVNIGKGEQRRPEFLAVNPLGKLPAMQVGGCGLAGGVWAGGRVQPQQVQAALCAAAALARPLLIGAVHPALPASLPRCCCCRRCCRRAASACPRAPPSCDTCATPASLAASWQTTGTHVRPPCAACSCMLYNTCWRILPAAGCCTWRCTCQRPPPRHCTAPAATRSCG